MVREIASKYESRIDPGRLRVRNAELRKNLLGIAEIARDTQNANTIFHIDVRVLNSKIERAMDVVVEVTKFTAQRCFQFVSPLK